MNTHYSKLALAGVALMTCAAPQAHSKDNENSTCYGMYVVDVYHCSAPLVALTKDPSTGKPLTDKNNNPITAYACPGTATKYASQKNRNANSMYLTQFAPVPIVPTSPANGGLTPANPDPRTEILKKGGVIYDPGTTTNRYAEKGADRLRTSIEASYCHKDGSGAWRGAVAPMCGYKLPLTAYQQAGMPQGTFNVDGAQANDFAVIIGTNTIWKDETHPQIQTFCAP